MMIHSLRLPFDTDDAEFARGFEAGRLWTLLGQRESVVEEYAHGVNAEMLLRMAEATGRLVQSEELGDDWLWVRFEAPGVALDDAA